MRGESSIALQHGNAGFYGKIVVDVSPTETDSLEVQFAPGVECAWQAAIHFGAAVVWEKLPTGQVCSKGMKIYVCEFKGHLVDTTQALVAYLTVCAVCSAIGQKLSTMPVLDKSAGVIVFAK